MFSYSFSLTLVPVLCTMKDLPPNVQYLKIYTAGHDVPSNSVILSFKRAVRAFLRENESNGRQPPLAGVIFMVLASFWQFRCFGIKNFIFCVPCPPEKLIGVHCTHGLNRTGYLVCRYLHISQLLLHLSKQGVSNSGPG